MDLVRVAVASVASVIAMSAAPQSFPDTVYAPLWNYNGTWKAAASGKSPDTIVNHCARTGLFFVCEQNVNGQPGALLVFVPVDAEGHYRTNPVQKDGHAYGPGELEIKGNHWTYLGKNEEGGKTIWYRTTNDFSGNSHIHFEQAKSTDKVNWEVLRSGDEVRVDKGNENH